MTSRNHAVGIAALETLESRRLLHAPSIDVIPAYSVPVNNTVQIPITATYDHGDKLVYTVSDNSNQVTATFRSAKNSFIEMRVQGYSDPMVFQLFDDVAPDTVRRLKGLIRAGYYDGLTFHRILNNFVIQGGDPAGNGSGGPGFKFDDEFTPAASLTGDGQLAMANSGKDTNGSQFFITEGAQRFLDFNHTVFGQLVRGKTTRNSISDVAVDGAGKPNSTVTITSVRLVENKTDAVLAVKLGSIASGTVTVTATGSEGTFSRSFTVTGVADQFNSPPILTSNAKVYYVPVKTRIKIQLTASDREGDAVQFGGEFVDNQLGITANLDPATGLLTIDAPANGAKGKVTLYVGVRAPNASTRGSTNATQGQPLQGIYDVQLITIAVGESPISASGVSFDATSGATNKGVPVATFRSSDRRDVAGNFTASINWGDGSVTSGSVSKNSRGTYSVYGTHAYSASGNEGAYPITVDINGNLGAYASATSTATVRSFASVSAGVLIVNGTSFNDRISVGRKGSNYVVTVNRTSRAFAVGTVNEINAYGFDGDDVIELGATGITIGSYLDGGAGNDNLIGSEGADVINAGAGRDTVSCRGGNDRVAGGDDADTISGGIGKDRLFGQLGNDSINGDGSPDIVSGDEGNDTVIGGSSNDTLYGGSGNDILNGLNGADSINGGAGHDTTKLDNTDVARIAVEVLV
ncbi:MAG: peptidylprolyl isomerase [Burkholderiales bacterium]|nr:peptidylprolyl isomerase [Phycisphaerae bacterium]